VLAVEATFADDLEDRLGDEVVERPTVREPCSQVGARHFEAGNLDAYPVDALREVDVFTGTIDQDASAARVSAV
jgi:hypothetical protein